MTSPAPDTRGILYVVATPIGNRDDLSPRAREVLSTVSWIAAEDTRHAGRLPAVSDSDARLISFHEHNEEKRVGELLGRLARGESGALVSDAGTPLISDPGYRLILAAREGGFRVSPVPGPCAAIAALSVSGLPTDRFLFVGFPPTKRGARDRRLESLADTEATLIFYEAPHRIKSLLEDLRDRFGSDREACLARELTKTYETVYYGSLAELVSQVNADSNAERGEMVLVVRGRDATVDADEQSLTRMLDILLEELPLKQAVKIAVRLSGARRNRVYELATKRGAV